MLKILAILGMVLTVAQALVPTAGKTPDNGARDGQHSKRGTKSSAAQTQPTPSVLAQQEGSQSLSPKSEETPESHQRATINVTYPASVSEWSWHEQVAWVSGLVTTVFLVWGVIVARNTLKAIEKQTAQVARSAKATEDAAVATNASVLVAIGQSEIANKTLVAQFRPRVIVRNIDLTNGAGTWQMHMLIVNIGGTKADVGGGKLDIRWRVGNEPRYRHLQMSKIEGFALGAGDERLVHVNIESNSTFGSKMNVFRIALKEGRPGKYTMQAAGVIRYADDFGSGKTTGFFRALNIETLHFVASQNTDEEYQD